LCDATRFMRHKVVAHKVIICQVTIISYSPVIQTKLYGRGLVGIYTYIK